MRHENKFNLFIGKSKDWEYIFLEESFMYKDWMSGLTWTLFEFLTQYELDKRIDDYDWLDLWKEAVYHWNCTESYQDWKDEILDNWDAEMTVRDNSYEWEEWLEEAMKYASEQEGYDYEYSDCRWWWRIFDEENIKEDYYEYFIPENLKKLQEQYREYEKSWNQN